MSKFGIEIRKGTDYDAELDCEGIEKWMECDSFLLIRKMKDGTTAYNLDGLSVDELANILTSRDAIPKYIMAAAMLAHGTREANKLVREAKAATEREFRERIRAILEEDD